MEPMATHEEIPSRHWADQTAEELIRRHPDKAQLVCASGISPSGVVHIGNFREVITVEFVARALRERERKVRFFHCWDDYDALRKVPTNLPQQDAIQAQMRKAITKVADPFAKESSYAAHFETLFQNEIARVGIHPEFVYQTKRYEQGYYAAEVRTALIHRKEIAAILDRWRDQPLPEKWTCVTIFCENCGRDTTKIGAFTEPSHLAYRCDTCGHEGNADFSKGSGVKLLWRIDWPARWAREGVDFEPCGKDHSTQGGSFETGCAIIKEIWKKEPPYNIHYDFVLAKGLGAKLSSSSGTLITVSQALEVYQPEVVRWIFASRKPNLDFTIAFDLDVLKAYDDYDRTERFAYGLEEADERKHTYEKRIYELSQLTADPIDYKKELVQFPFRHLCNILQIFEGDLDKTVEHYRETFKGKTDETRLLARAKCAWTWITEYAPEDFRFRLRQAGTPIDRSAHPDLMRELSTLLRAPETARMGEEALSGAIFQLMKASKLETKLYFAEVYRLLISRKQGPRLASFILTIGLDRAASLIDDGV